MILLSVVIALVLNSVSAQSPLARTEIGQPKSLAADYLLPSNIKPSLYEVELEPNFDAATFNGSIRITVSVVATTNAIVLHTYQLTVETASISLLDVNGAVVNSIAGTSFSNDDRQFYTISFEEVLVEGNVYTLIIDSFSGILNSQNDGFYLARYTDEEGNTRKLATTQFEATSARRAFPCFDEPALKAQFDISIIRTAEYHSISNMPQVSSYEISEGRFLDKFARSVIMSTYLIAFVISDFDYTADLNHRIFLRPALIANNRADYAIGVSPGILDAIADFVNVPYALDKMDQIGIPDGYFSAGAMENWGLVTYRETYLIYVNRLTLATSKQTSTTIISHEFGHQWFGNLVSPLWWTYLWLNEGFATYLEYYGASVVDGSMDLMDQMVINSVQYALGRDATTSTRPMNKEVGSPRDINSLFDTVAYDKSGSVIRMVEGVMTTEAFRIGLNHYLNKMQWGAARPSDLYSSWQAALDSLNINPFPEDVNTASFMGTWDSNAGFPLVIL
ncbi:Peptidase M1 N-terminal domain [Popillia japonica]|uniref:Peptidase M1 N-terminal domain n=1 Tax=Popillia japonica TaxID=7064 RepID=A0AAW1L7B4_POPJA